LSSESSTSRAIIYAVVILLVIAGAALLINSRVGGVQVYDVYPTISMQPTLDVGDLVVVLSTPYSNLHVGDVIVFSPPNGDGGCEDLVIVHRIVNITSAGIYTWGDDRLTNQRADEPLSWPPVTSNCVKGMVVVSIPYLGKISEAFPPPENYILVAIIVIAIFMIELMGGKKQEDKVEEGETASTNPGTAPPPSTASFRHNDGEVGLDGISTQYSGWALQPTSRA
jgi:signal peptidase I